MRAQVATTATLGEQLGAALEQAIIEGEFEPGQRLNADEIADRFGVSRIPVREALRSLDATGWVEIRPRHGAYVRRRSEEELLQLFEVRAVLEHEAAKLAAERRDAAQLAELEQLAKRSMVAARKGQLEKLAEVNAALHLAVAKASGNQVLSSIIERIEKRVRWYYATVPPARGQAAAAEHVELVEAIKRQDAEAAADIVHRHVDSTLHALEQGIAKGEGDSDTAGQLHGD